PISSVNVVSKDGANRKLVPGEGDAEERAETIKKHALALFRLQKARELGEPAFLKQVEARVEDDLPTTPREQADAQAVLKKAHAEAPKKAARTWGLLGMLGFHEWLESIDNATRSNFMPYGISGIMLGAALVFFAYIGFDSISTHAEEAIRPQ